MTFPKLLIKNINAFSNETNVTLQANSTNYKLNDYVIWLLYFT